MESRLLRLIGNYSPPHRDRVTHISYVHRSTKRKKKKQKMGLDGGTIATNSRILSQSQNQNKTSSDDGGVTSANQAAHNVYSRRWRTCALSGQLLSHGCGPICVDRLGNLLLKTSVLELLIARKTSSAERVAVLFPNSETHFSHLRKMKDVVEIVLVGDKSTTSTAVGSTKQHISEDDIPRLFFSCAMTHRAPQTHLVAAASPESSFYVRWSCGHVLSQRAVCEAEEMRSGKTPAAGNSFTNSSFCPVPSCCKAGESSALVKLVPPPVVATDATSAAATVLNRRRAREHDE